MWYIKDETNKSVNFYIGNNRKTLKVDPEFLSKKFYKKNLANIVFVETYENLLIDQGYNKLDSPTELETDGIKPVPECMREMIEYARNSVKVTVERLHGYVSICDPLDDRDDDGIFLQDEEGMEFINRINSYWNTYDLTVEEAEFLAAYPYCDMF